jgi:hypothetical protein
MANKVDTLHAEYVANQATWARCRAFTAGSDAVKGLGTVLLAKLSGQDDTEYQAYKERAQLYNATGRTVDAMSGLVMRIDPTFELPPKLADLETDADYCGTSLFEFAKIQVGEILQTARSGILVDYPTRGDNIVTVAQANATGLRPYLAHYPSESIINWRTERKNGATVLTKIVLKESFETADPDDEFVMLPGVQFRVLDLDDGGYRQRVFRQGDRDWEQFGEDILPTRAGKRMDEIPFVFMGVDSNTPNVQKSPVIDLVNVNLGHYRNSADHEHGLHFTGLPTPVITGHHIGEDEEIAIGSESFLVLNSPEAQAFFLEFSGSGLGSLLEAMQEKKKEMASLGARMIEDPKNGIEAAETAKIHRSGEGGVLASLASSVSKGIRRALQIAADWAGDSGEVQFELNKDFMPASMDSNSMKVLMEMWQSGGISHQVLFDNLKRGEIIREEIDLDDMKSDIDNDLPGTTGFETDNGAGAE